MKNFLIKNSYPLILCLIVLVVCFQNYTFGTFLSGWDTLHPEFNFPEYFKRIFSFWQQHQGLGAAASQAHSAELPRLVLYYLSSFILPISFLRYFYIFVCLLIGPLGTYFFIKKIIKKNFIAFLSSLLYLLNLVTVQQFFVPLEMFTTHYATLPWIFLFSTNYLLEKKKKDLVFFSLAIIFSSPSAHTPTLYYSFLLVFGSYLLLFYKLISKSFKSILIILGMILVLNSYWILPNFYYVTNYGESVITSKINYQFSERAFQTGVNYGNFIDTAILRNFLFDWGEYSIEDGRFVFLLKVWKDHFNNPVILFIGFLIFFSVVGGIILSFKNKNKIGFAFLPVFIIPYLFINNDNFIFQGIVNFLSSNFSIVRESLRFPFTKFSIMLLFSFCLYFAIFLDFITEKFKYKLNKYHNLGWTLLGSFLIILFALPVFTGNMISKSMRVNIPDEYFQMYDYFKTQNPNQRIATFPINNFWGWIYYNFNFEGAGFLWFGLSQPTMDREFDRWHPANEDYYHQMSYAVYSQDLKLFEDVLEKYQINYLLVDKNVVDVSSPKATFFPQLEEMISKSTKINKDKQFNNLNIYKVNLDNTPTNFVSLLNTLTTVGPIYDKNNNDSGFVENGNYIASDSSEIYYPFRSLLSNRNVLEEEFTVDENDKEFVFRKKIPKEVSTKQLNIPDNENLPWFDPTDLSIAGLYNPTTSFDGDELVVRIPKIKNYFSDEIDPSKKITKLKNCDYLSAENPSSFRRVDEKIVDINDKNVLRLDAVLSNNCSAEFILPNMSHELSYLISLESRNIQSKSILFWIENLTTKKTDLETYLPKVSEFQKLHFIQPPMDIYGQGYFLHFDNLSFNKKATVNDLGGISIYPIPYNYLTKIYFGNDKTKNISNFNDCIKSVNHPIAYYYSVNLKDDCQNNAILVLSQSTDPGWIAFDRNSLKLLSDKKLINNWENGWGIDTGKIKSVIIFYIPQLLQFLGYLIFIVGIIFIVLL